jgi:hypothetical protein
MTTIVTRRQMVLGFFLAASAVGATLAAPPFLGVPAPNPKATGFTAPNILTPELTEVVAAQGANALENPTTVDLGGGSSIEVTHYGYYGDGPFLAPPCVPPGCPTPVEAKKSEPDKNTYLVFRHGLPGADPDYDYGRHFLFQGHEAGPQSSTTGNPMGYITRINLDADAAHRVTLLAATDVHDQPLPEFDGSTWNPWARKLLFTSELSPAGGVFQATVDEVPATVEDLFGSIGHGGFEGIQNDSDGNLWIVEDVGGGNDNTHCNRARQPNSFVYRFKPDHPGDLGHGKMQVLQIISVRTGLPITFHAGDICGDALSQDMADLHTYGFTFDTKWVTIHDTATDTTAPFDANALAKAKGGTPLKRPENGLFRPGSGFTQFFFDETGDTNADTVAAAANDPGGVDHGGFGAILKLTQSHPSANHGRLRMFYRGDKAHTGLDNCAFWSDDEIVFVEDAGDTLHTQRNAFDSAYLFDLDTNFALPGKQPVRLLAQGRDASATLDSALAGIVSGFPNDQDNEITGIHVSDGDPSLFGILGAKIPHHFRNGWRVFYTQQHGDNVTYEILKVRRHSGSERDDDMQAQ